MCATIKKSYPWADLRPKEPADAGNIQAERPADAGDDEDEPVVDERVVDDASELVKFAAPVEEFGG